MQVFLLGGLVSLLERHHKRERKKKIQSEENRDWSPSILAKENFVLISFVLCDSKIFWCIGDLSFE